MLRKFVSKLKEEEPTVRQHILLLTSALVCLLVVITTNL